jgi:hypothetical protein
MDLALVLTQTQMRAFALVAVVLCGSSSAFNLPLREELSRRSLLQSAATMLPTTALLLPTRPALAALNNDGELRNALNKLIEEFTAVGKGADPDRRGDSNQKALFDKDFYYSYGIRPSPSDTNRFLAGEKMPFADPEQKIQGYQKYERGINKGLSVYSGELKNFIQDGKWAECQAALVKGNQRGQVQKGGDAAVIPAPVRASCRKFGLFANTMLQSPQDKGTSLQNLLVRHFINEAYFAMDDIAVAAAAGDKQAATAAWTRGRDYINAYLGIVNQAFRSDTGDKFPLIDASIE